MKIFDHKFTAGGTEYTLSYTFAARRAFERKYKKSVPGSIRKLADVDTQTADALIDVFLLLLGTHHPDITEEQVVVLIDQMGGDDEAMNMLRDVLADNEKNE